MTMAAKMKVMHSSSSDADIPASSTTATLLTCHTCDYNGNSWGSPLSVSIGLWTLWSKMCRRIASSSPSWNAACRHEAFQPPSGC